ncbi:hypothetical protein [Massilia antarctica]|uniref:hypothetical protein n=1 Tax=Massilia antarctica TaxID=2765360 RepID=UPI0022704994|nr:hypothetical protein [Massilia sp. H27-R4]MCY0910895.1 hypothetical protein [Massilia sp. H27-R4]
MEDTKLPSAARNAGIELAAQCLITRAEHHYRVRNYAMQSECLQSADAIRAHKFFVGPVVDAYTALHAEVALMTAMLDEGEWAEHAATTPHGQCLETAITRLIGKASAPAPVQQPTPSAALWAQFEQWMRDKGVSAPDVIIIPDEAAPVEQAAPDRVIGFGEALFIKQAKAQQAAPSGRAAFEAWHNEKFRWMSTRCSILNFNYADQRTQERWETWQAATAAPAQSASLSEQDKLDAARWRMLESVYFNISFVEDGDKGCPRLETSFCYQGFGLTFVAWVRSKVDAAILAAKEAP